MGKADFSDAEFKQPDDLAKARTINVDTYNGVVTLYGNVPNQTVVDRAVELARGVKNVKQVVSKLTVGPN